MATDSIMQVMQVLVFWGVFLFLFTKHLKIEIELIFVNISDTLPNEINSYLSLFSSHHAHIKQQIVALLFVLYADLLLKNHF
jgi:hypothetical protein